MRIYFGSDHAAIELRQYLRGLAAELGHEVVADHGPNAPGEKADYPDVAATVSREVAADRGSFGVLVCGTGQGMAMTANRVPGIRAAVVLDTFSAKMARAHNDANVLCMGGRVVGLGLARELFEAFFATAFEGGRHEPRVRKIGEA
jgi:ribose 5-phosphate isomerase B